MTDDAPFWEAGYADPAAETFGPASAEVVGVAGRLQPGAVALDLGCGDGRNAVAIAELGVAVHAVDRSAAGITRLRARARAAGADVTARVTAWVQDLETFVFRRSYDLVVAHGVLHLLARPAWSALLDDMRRHTLPGGWNVVVVFTDRLPPPPDLAPHTRGLFREGELRERYEDWDIERWEAYTLDDEHPGGVRHRHPINGIVARRPRAPAADGGNG